MLNRSEARRIGPPCVAHLLGALLAALSFLVLFVASAGFAAAQNATSPFANAPTFGSTGGLSIPEQSSPFAGIQSANAKAHMGPDGKPCLSVSGNSVPETLNPHIFKHMVIADNRCSIAIKVQVCYYESSDCTPLSAPPYGRGEAVLGIMPAMSQFRFEYREQFDSMTGFGFR